MRLACRLRVRKSKTQVRLGVKLNPKRLIHNMYSIGFLILFNCSLKPQENSLDPATTEGLILSLFTAPQVADLSGLVANYTFTGNSNDSVAGRNLTVGGGAPTLTADRFGVANSAYAFDGASFFTASDSAPSGLPSGSNPRTICLWYNLTAVTGNTVIQYGAGTAGNAFGLAVYPAFHEAYTYSYGVYANVVPTTNIWRHVCIVGTGTDLLVYINGALVAQGFSPSTNTVLSSLAVGKSNFQADFITGSLDEVRIYNRALRSVDVAAVYTAGQ